ncbi:hypothetical protein SAMN04487897_107188 [Paenibacillus sp. yr247]|uniref:DUF6572 domain-containing protein n=1 Tax=Paenibacillus sp. yr247 TaxID=1761880 RepID=UPI000886B397|nr:DUF6572 domain-containing protein [Paenibacillus sp. yr247]SDO04833.1 hypothetical protein SAMN04487897_107188 [Paenibacillus sp. yr247]
MTLENANELDSIGLDKVTGEVNLTIKDDVDWNDIQLHLSLLQEKINTYLSFIESGEIDSSYPKSINKRKKITIYFKHQVCDEAIEFLTQANQIVIDAGFGFECLEWNPTETGTQWVRLFS